MGTRLGGGPEMMEMAVIMAGFQWRRYSNAKSGFGLKRVSVHTDCSFIDTQMLKRFKLWILDLHSDHPIAILPAWSVSKDFRGRN